MDNGQWTIDNGQLRIRKWTKGMDKTDGQRQMDERNGHPGHKFLALKI